MVESIATTRNEKSFPDCISDIRLEELVSIVKKNNPDEDLSSIRNAFFLARAAHSNQFRESKEPYFVHPLEAAFILARLGVNPKLVTTALLHDIIEDTSVTFEDIKENFGEEIATLVAGLTKLDLLRNTSRKQRDLRNLKKMLFAGSKDLCVLVVKLGDKLHNMRTLEHLSEGKKRRIASDVLSVYVPLTKKLGIHIIQRELEDLSFKNLEPKKYFDLNEKISEIKSDSLEEINKTIEILKENDPSLQIEILEKNVYSIYNKMKMRNRKLSQIYDFFVVQILTDTISECYNVLGKIHSIFNPVPLKLKDYIALPKEGLYQSIHTAVIGPFGRPIKFYIMTRDMSKVNDLGVITCLSLGSEEGMCQKILNDKINMLSKHCKSDVKAKSTKEYMDVTLGTDFQSMTVFDKDGNVVELAGSATALDFAFLKQGKKAVYMKSAIVNDQEVPIWYELSVGDRVEIISGKTVRVNYDWLSFVKYNRFKPLIKSFLKESELDEKNLDKVTLKVSGVDRVGLTAEILYEIKACRINVDSAKICTDKKAKSSLNVFRVDIYDPSVLKKVVKRLKKVKDVTKVEVEY